MKTNKKKFVNIILFGFIGLFLDSALNSQGILAIIFSIATATYHILEKLDFIISESLENE